MPLLHTMKSPLLAVWKIEESWEELLAMSSRQEDYRSRIEQFKSDRRRSEWLAVRLLLREILGEEPLIAYHPTGAPFLPDSPYHLSISHTKGYAAVILSLEQPVGIDIEYLSDRVRRIASRFLSSEELAALGDSPSQDALLVCWSAKETLFKVLAISSADLREDLSLVAFPGDDTTMGTVTLCEQLTPACRSFELHYQVTKEYVITYFS